MPPVLSTETLTLEALLGRRLRFRVPGYQRAYSWTTREAGQLLDDLLVALAEDPGYGAPREGYFLGAMLLIADDSDVAADMRDIVDGQQRLLTLTILLAVLRDLGADRGLALRDVLDPLLSAGPGSEGPLCQRIELHSEDNAFLQRFVLTPGACAIMPEVDVDGAAQRILDVREHFVGELVRHGSDELVELVGYLRSSCFAAVMTTRTIDRAHRIFTVLNNRGRPLARNDILKAQILGMIPAERRGAYSERWHALERRSGDRFEDLFSHIRSIYGRSRERVISGIGELVRESGGAERFFDTILEPFGKIHAAIIEAAGPTPAIARSVGYLGWIGSTDWVPAAMLWWHICGGDPVPLEAFLRRYERLAFCLRLLGIGADKRHARFNAVSAAIRAGALDAPGSPLELTREETRNIVHNLRGLHTRSQLTCKLLLLRLNDEFAGSPQRLDPQEYTVEHVLPQRPGRSSQWRKVFSSTEEREACTQSLGNLVIVTREQNERARNAELARKLAIYFAEGADRMPHITRDIEGLDAWGPADVKAREDRLLAAVERLWNLEPCLPGAALAASPEPPLGPRAKRGKAQLPAE